MGCGGCKRPPAYLRWLPRCTGPVGPADWLPRHTCPGSPDKRRNLPKESCGRPGYGDRHHVRRCEAVSGLHSALSVRAIPGPTLSLAFAVEIALALGLAVAVEIALALSLAVAVEIALAVALIVIPVADTLRPDGLSCAARRGSPGQPDARSPPTAGLVLRGGLVSS